LIGLVGTILIVGCSDDPASDDTASDVTASSAPTTQFIPIATSPSGADDPNFPVEVVDCGGRTTEFTRAAERIVALDETAAETLVRLGARDLIVGIVRDHPDDELWEVTQSDLLSRQVVADASTPLTREAIERVGPDLVLGAVLERFEGPAAVTRQEWSDAGLTSLLFRADCELPTDEDTEGDGLAQYHADLRALAAVLGEPVKGEKLVSEAQAAMQTLTAEVEEAGVGDRTVWIVGGDGAGSHAMARSVLRTLGVQVIDAGATPSQVAEADPDLIWLITPRGADVEIAAGALRSELLADPTLASLPAVEGESIVVTAAADIAPSPRFTLGARALVDALIQL
jgi:ABC-type Fe3+-hydroxamate transport system substrate-binding protein